MTTIAYKHKDKEIAVDSQITAGGLICSQNENKTTKVNGVTFITTGVIADIEPLIDSFFGQPPAHPLEAKAIVIKDGEVFEYFHDGNRSYMCPINYDSAWGSGQDFALSAMDFGCNAREAVKYASKRDSGTGGRVRLLKVK